MSGYKVSTPKQSNNTQGAKITISDINQSLRVRRDLSEEGHFSSILKTFVSNNEISNRGNEEDEHLDDLSYLFVALEHFTNIAKTKIENNWNANVPNLHILVLKTLKIVTRKSVNRHALPPNAIPIIIEQLSLDKINTSLTQNSNVSNYNKVIIETVNLLLNLCYERENVESVLDLNTIDTLIELLRSEDNDIKAGTAGSIQSMCYQQRGRDEFSQKSDVLVPSLLNLLSVKNLKVQARATGALHNLSSKISIVLAIRDKNGIQTLVDLLIDVINQKDSLKLASQADKESESEDKVGVNFENNTLLTEIICSISGAIQNISRENQCRKVVQESGAVNPLTDLLFCDHIPTQTSAVGALLNLLSTENKECSADLKKLLSMSMIMGIALDCLNTPSETNETERYL
eukprot:TRINITY_DN2702_c0_g1_i1.p1 TRINITY_DN2702_c0_g1~~TRINITY_DN2702_c0_g1_i1.p1  ORF type:complete len:403 (-),score=93.22 TRINITY_DN2702_c0_g1_i1:100-1308(-)